MLVGSSLLRNFADCAALAPRLHSKAIESVLVQSETLILFFFLSFTNLILTASQRQCLLPFPHSVDVKFASREGLAGSSGPSNDTLILPSGPASIHPPVLSSLAKGKDFRQSVATWSSAAFTAIQLLVALARFSISTCARHRPKDSIRGSRHTLLKPVVWKTPLS